MKEEKDDSAQIKIEDLKNNKKKQDQAVIEQIESNIKRIKKIAFKRKALTVLLVLILMILFSVYFIASLLMAQNNYSTTVNASIDLNTIFQKEVCLENLLIYIRENYIQNKSVIVLGTGGKVASDYFLDICLE